jgi:cytochrome c1
MSRITASLATLLVALTLIAANPAYARAPKKHQVTGKVLEVTSDYIAVDKAGDRWEIGRDADTKITGKLKVGATVTIEYVMSARTVDVKDKK